MSRDPNMQAVSLDIPREVADAINEFCEQSGLTKWRVLVGGFYLMKEAPLFIRDASLRGDIQAIAGFWRSATASLVPGSANSPEILSALLGLRTESRPAPKPARRKK